MSKFVPRPYQKLIVNHILEKERCAVWASMGMGKTSASLIAAQILTLFRPSPVLVIAPLRVARSTWPNETAKWDDFQGLKVQPIIGALNERRQALHTDADIFTTNYDNLIDLVEYWGNDWPYEIVIADEASKLKGFRLRQGGKRTQALARIAHTKIKYMIELTGTPATNGLIDLWGQMWFIDGGVRLGKTFTAFKNRWFRPAKNGFGSEACDFANTQIHEAISDVCLTVRAEDWFELDAPIFRRVDIDLPKSVQPLYREMEKNFFAELASGHTIEAVNSAAKSQKLLQLSSGAVYLDRSVDDDTNPRSKEWKEVHAEKLEALDEIISESGDAAVIVAYHFRSDLLRLQKRYPQAVVLDADPTTERRWNAGKIPILLAHPASAGHGLNLQDGGRILVFFTPTWNLEHRLQMIERIGPLRQLQSGHKRSVFVYDIMASKTVDDIVAERVRTKRSIQELLLEAMKAKGYKS